MRILSWNICCLPNYINLYQNPNCVIDNIIRTISYFKADFICLQEIFDTKAIETIKRKMSNYNIIYDTPYKNPLQDNLSSPHFDVYS